MIATTSAVLPNQLPLPFSEARPSGASAPPVATADAQRDRAEPTHAAPPDSSRATGAGVPASRSLAAVHDYLRRHFPEFILQQRFVPSGSVQVTLYRVPDGTLYRLTIDAGFLADRGESEAIEGMLETHGLRQKLPASVLSPIVLDQEGIHLPTAATQTEQASPEIRSSLGWMLLGRLMQATGLSLPLSKERSPS